MADYLQGAIALRLQQLQQRDPNTVFAWDFQSNRSIPEAEKRYQGLLDGMKADPLNQRNANGYQPRVGQDMVEKHRLNLRMEPGERL